MYFMLVQILLLILISPHPRYDPDLVSLCPTLVWHLWPNSDHLWHSPSSTPWGWVCLVLCKSLIRLVNFKGFILCLQGVNTSIPYAIICEGYLVPVTNWRPYWKGTMYVWNDEIKWFRCSTADSFWKGGMMLFCCNASLTDGWNSSIWIYMYSISHSIFQKSFKMCLSNVCKLLV